jgi:uncharacterized protein
VDHPRFKKRLFPRSYLLIIANSGRMLAQAARNSGYLPLVVDCFGDLDTRHAAEAVFAVPDLGITAISGVVERIIRDYSVNQMVYGAGFETRLDSLRWLAERFAISGNQPEIFAAATDKFLFFECLRQENIAFPETRFKKPPDALGWLFKPWQGSGGARLVRAVDAPRKKGGGYWQYNQPGLPHSVLFVADGINAVVIGYHRQWTRALGKQVFMFDGIINATNLTAAQKTQLSTWVKRLTAHFALTGLNSLDLIAAEDGLSVLEINARPPASMQLYGADLLQMHLAACRGELPDESRDELQDESFDGSKVAAYRIFYADKITPIPDTMVWPEGALDLPQPGAVINTHQPICSMIARNHEPDKVLLQLAQMQTFILNQLEK